MNISLDLQIPNVKRSAVYSPVYWGLNSGGVPPVSMETWPPVSIETSMSRDDVDASANPFPASESKY